MKEIEIKYKDSSLCDEQEISGIVSQLEPYIGNLRGAADDQTYSNPEASLHLPFDTKILETVAALVKEFDATRPKYIIVAGIGGSNLGTQAVYEAMRPKLSVATSSQPRIIFADTNDPRESEALKNFLDKKVLAAQDVVLNIVTKSGTTAETVANASFLFDALAKRFGEEEILPRIVVTTDENSALWKIAQEKKIKCLTIPKMVGGRYSVFTAVGLFPLSLAGIEVSELLVGAKEMAEKCFVSGVAANPALISAATVFLSSKKGVSIANSFFFHTELEGLGKWWRQLTAESLGKNGTGVTPIVSIGSTDLHSMVQLYFGGPQDKFTNFVYAVYDQTGRVSVPENSFLSSLVPDIDGKDFADIMKAIREGTEEAYKENNMPFIETVLPDISEKSVGAFMQMKMIETMLLAKLLNINAFDQPEVENYKKHTKELLKK